MPALSRGMIDSDPLHIRILYARHMTIDHTWNDRGVSNPYWRYYVNYRDGAAVRLIDGSLYPLRRDAVHLIPAWVRIDLVTDQPVPHLWAHFDIVGIPGTVIRAVFPRPISLPLDASLRTTADAMRQLLSDAGAVNRPDVLFAAKAAIHLSLAQVFAQLPERARARISSVVRPDSPVAPALRFIEENVRRSVRVAALARLCGYAEDHFARLFRREVGQTPAQYVLERRVAAAAQRLILGTDSIDRIAEDCGFPDRFYFSRVFSRRMGMPPVRYRRTQPSGRV